VVAVTDQSPEYLTPAEVADRWRCDSRTVRRRVAAGELRGVRLGPGIVRVSAAEVERYERRAAEEAA
jgi:excisionase family DNA binding protein